MEKISLRRLTDEINTLPKLTKLCDDVDLPFEDLKERFFSLEKRFNFQILTASQKQAWDLKRRLAVFGANSCGKSAVINSILKTDDIAPSSEGHTTGRILRFTYGTIASVLEVVDWDKNIDGMEKVISFTPLDWKFVQEESGYIDDMILPLLKRPEDENEIEEWVRVMVVITCPIDILKDGLDIFDTPGVSCTDLPCVQNTIQAFFTRFQPVIVFVYSNPSISDAEASAFSTAKENMRVSCYGENGMSRIFFMSNHADTDECRVLTRKRHAPFDENSLKKDFASLSETRRHMLEKSVIGSFLRIENFVPYSARDILLINMVRDEFVKQHLISMFTSFWKNLVAFAERSAIESRKDAIFILAEGIKTFLSLKKEERSTILSKLDDAKKEFDDGMADAILSIPKDPFIVLLEDKISGVRKNVPNIIRDFKGKDHEFQMVVVTAVKERVLFPVTQMIVETILKAISLEKYLSSENTVAVTIIKSFTDGIDIESFSSRIIERSIIGTVAEFVRETIKSVITLLFQRGESGKNKERDANVLLDRVLQSFKRGDALLAVMTSIMVEIRAVMHAQIDFQKENVQKILKMKEEEIDDISREVEDMLKACSQIEKKISDFEVRRRLISLAI